MKICQTVIKISSYLKRPLFRYASDVLRLAIENELHRKVYSIAAIVDENQAKQLRQLLETVFKIAKEGWLLSLSVCGDSKKSASTL